ncbi:MAG: RES family NAD+ phosphorylase [Bacteroidia bacterium]|nr:RES family NAD+ phosphorylase [Bacteroidia bacterium]
MRVFRIEREKHLSATLLGLGASLSSGFRWNGLHTRMVYTSESRALATVEVTVHLDLSEDLPNDRYYVELDIPDKLLILELNRLDLPLGWDSKPPGTVSQKIGDTFVSRNEAAVLKVPSAIVPFEYNFLINPNHPDAAEIKVVQTWKMEFDKRIKDQEI